MKMSNGVGIQLNFDEYFVDLINNLYAGIIAFSFTIIHSSLVKVNETGSLDWFKHLLLFLMAFAFIISDWTGSRTIVKDYCYVSNNFWGRARVYIDILIGCLYYVLIICASLLSAYYLLVFSLAFFLGSLWSYFIRLEYRYLRAWKLLIDQDIRLKVIEVTHISLAAFFLGVFAASASLKDNWANTSSLLIVNLTFWLALLGYKIICLIRL